MRDIVDWFLDIFGDTIWEEGWYIVYNNNFFTIEPIDKPDIKKLSFKECEDFAKQYGWITGGTNPNGLFIQAFDLNKLTKKKHLITGSELGLL